MKPLRLKIAPALLLLWSATVADDTAADEVRIAVAANFGPVIREIAQGFEQATGHQAIISTGSTGKLYAQILQHAPFDVFLSADQQHPELLVEQQLATERFTYAIGELVLWSSDPALPVDEATLKKGEFTRIALANPKTAPYGAAAISVMRHLGVEDTLRAKFIQGESIGQTYQFVASGNVELGFVAKSQIALESGGESWEIPQAYYPPIRQDAVLLTRSERQTAARQLLAYLKAEAAKEVIQRYGYRIE